MNLIGILTLPNFALPMAAIGSLVENLKVLSLCKKWTSFIMFIFVLMISSTTMADEIGHFAICDTVIEASWLDKEFKYGYAKIEPDSTNPLETAKWVFFAITDRGYHFYDLDALVKKYGESRFFKLLKSARISIGFNYSYLYITSPHIKENVGSSYKIFGRIWDKSNICVYLPQKKMVWLFEWKTVSASKLEYYFDRMPEEIGNDDYYSRRGNFRLLTYYDLNSDNEIDFFDSGSGIVYFSKDGTYKYMYINHCFERLWESRYILSDGKDVFIGNNKVRCNISELSR